MGPRIGLDGRKMSSLPGFDPGPSSPVAQSLYRLSYPAHGIQYGETHKMLSHVTFGSNRTDIMNTLSEQLRVSLRAACVCRFSSEPGGKVTLNMRATGASHQ